jgi:hypothetical protein
VTGRGLPPPTRSTQPKQPEYDEDGRPIAPEGPRKSFPGDWLLN